MILRREFPPGQYLREISLAEQFSVSRTPIRAALAANAKDGLLEHIPNKGYIVRSFDVNDIIQAYEMRAVLEGTACRKAAEAGLSIEAERDARRAIDLVDGLFHRPDPFDQGLLDQWRAQNRIFHDAILNRANNRFLLSMMQLVQQVPSVSPPVLAPYKLEDLRVYNEHQRKILECIIYRQGARAEVLMREHLYSACDAICASIRSHTPPEGN